MSEWYEVTPKPWSPCDGCEMGHGAISHKVEGGKLYQKFDSCQETCERYKDYYEGDMVKRIAMRRIGALRELGKH